MLLLATLLAACAPGTTLVDQVVVLPEDPDTSDDLTAVVTLLGDDEPATPERLRDLGFDVRWVVDGEDAGIDGLSVPAAATARGQAWIVEVAAPDVLDPWTGAAGIGNAPPRVLAFLPDVDGREDLVATVSATDDDGDEVLVDLSWSRDDRPVDVDGTVVPASETNRGETWTLYVSGDDGRGGTADAFAETVIRGAPPEVYGLRILPDDPDDDSTLVATATVVDPDGDPVTRTWSWTVDRQAVQADSDQLPARFTRPGDLVRVALVVDDGGAPVGPFEAEVTVAP